MVRMEIRRGFEVEVCDRVSACVAVEQGLI
jgi:hypothetical protein